MPRVISLFLPTWPTDRWRRKIGTTAPPPETPVVLIGRTHGVRVIVAADAAAQAAGLAIGMTAAKGQALVPGLVLADATPRDDEAALDRLAVWALRRYAPIVAVDPPDGLIIEASGAAHLHGGEHAMLTDLIARLASAGISARAAMADYRAAAHALARFAARPALALAAGRSPATLPTLPIAALRLPPATLDALQRLGFARIGDLAAQPRAPLTLRFGPDLMRRLDQALGRCPEPLTPTWPADLIVVRRTFAEPISAPETLARHTGPLVARVCARLAARCLGARRLDLLFHRVDNRIEAIRIGTARPVRDEKRLTRLLCDRLETIDPGFGVERMSLAVPVTEKLLAQQASTLLDRENTADVAGLIDTLSNRVGASRLYRFMPVASDVPERAVRRVAPLAPPLPAGDPPWPSGWPRPSRLLRRPEPIATVALLPDHPPVSFTWRGVRRRVRRADGPERVFGEWWKRPAERDAVRDYFQVEDESGQRFWIYRAGDGEDAATGSQDWFLHGVFG